MQTITISVPETVKSYLDAQVSAGRCSSHDEFLCRLVTEESLRGNKQKVNDLLQEGLRSGSSEFTQDDWVRLRAIAEDGASQDAQSSPNL